MTEAKRTAGLGQSRTVIREQVVAKAKHQWRSHSQSPVVTTVATTAVRAASLNISLPAERHA